MARIKDKKKIPIKDVPNVEDYLVGSDSEDGGKTANFKIGAIRGGSSMTDAAVKIAYENNLNTNEFSDAEKSKLDGLGDDTSIYDSDGTIGTGVTRNVTVDGTLAIKNASFQGINFMQSQFSIFHPDLVLVGADNSLALKDGFPATLDGSHGIKFRIGSGGVAASPTAGQLLSAKDTDGDLEWVDAPTGGGTMTDAEVKTAYENNADTNAFTDAEKVVVGNTSGTNTGDQVLTGLDYEPTKGVDDNYVTDAEKVVIGNTSNTNTGDITLTTTGSGAATLVGQALNIPIGGSGSVDDTAYAVSWDGVTTVAPSKNALYDFIESQVFKVDENSLLNPIFWGGTQAQFDAYFNITDFPAGVPDEYFTIITDASPPAIEGIDIVSTGVTAGFVLQADGDNTSSWVAPSGGGLANIVEDTTPQLGGNLDLNGNVITGLEIGTNVQAYSAALDAVTGTNTGDKDIYGFDGTIGAGVTRNVTVDGTLGIKDGSSQGITFSQTQFSLFHPDIAFLGSDSALTLKNGIPTALVGSYGVRLEIGEAGTEIPPTVGQVLAAKDVDGGLEWVDSPITKISEQLLVSSATLNLDWGIKTHYITLAGNSGISTESNLPPQGQSDTITIYVETDVYSFAFPQAWTDNGNVSGGLQPSVLNTIVVENVAITGTPFYRILISQAD